MQGNDGILKNIFIRYLETAITRTRNAYIKKMEDTKDELVVPEILQELFTDKTGEICEIQEKLPVDWNPEKIRRWLKAELDKPLWNVMKRLTDFEITLIYAKVFEQKTFVEIAGILKLDWQKVASSYTYARRKIKKELENHGV